MLHSGEEKAISDKENSEVFLSSAAEKRKHQLKTVLQYVIYMAKNAIPLRRKFIKIELWNAADYKQGENKQNCSISEF